MRFAATAGPKSLNLFEHKQLAAVPYNDTFLASWIRSRLGGETRRTVLLAEFDTPTGLSGDAQREQIQHHGGHPIQLPGRGYAGVWGLLGCAHHDPDRLIAAAAAARQGVGCFLHAFEITVAQDKLKASETAALRELAAAAGWTTALTAPGVVMVSENFRMACGIDAGLSPVSLPVVGQARAPKPVYILDASSPLPVVAGDSPVAIAAQLDNLGDLNALVLAAAIAGLRFSVATLAGILQADAERLAPALEAACQAGVIEPCCSRSACFRFRDPALHSAAYAMVPAAKRMQLHRQAAQTFDRRDEASAMLETAEIARHHQQARNAGQTRRWLSKAAWHAIARGETATAVAHLQEALAQSDENGQTALNRAMLQLLGIQLAVTKGNGSNAVFDAYLKSIAVAGESERLAWGQEFRSLWLAQTCHVVKGEVRAAMMIGNLLQSQLNKRAERSESAFGRRLLAKRVQGLTLMLNGQLDEALSQYDYVVTHYKFNSHGVLRFAYGSDQQALAYAHQAWIYAIMGRSGASAHAARLARRASDRLQHNHTTAHVISVLAMASLVMGATNEAELLAREARTTAVESGFQYWVAWSDAVLGATAIRQSARTAYDMLDAALAAYCATDAVQLCPFIYRQMSQAALAGGRTDQALEYADAGLSLVRHNDCLIYRPELYSARAAALFSVGEAAEANEALERGYIEAVAFGAARISREIIHLGIQHARGREQINWQVRLNAAG